MALLAASGYQALAMDLPGAHIKLKLSSIFIILINLYLVFLLITIVHLY